MDDWKGEHFIRGIRGNRDERISENARLAQVVTKLRGKGKPSAENKKKHVGICGAVLRGGKG